MASTTTRVEPLYVLYGSQMGNSEQAAKDFCVKLKAKYTKDFFEQQGLTPIQVETTCIQLDDFLEIKHADFTKCLVIFVSSYGHGQAPLGSYRFREICEALEQAKNESQAKEESTSKPPLDGLSFALCGVGDSAYPTYLRNPTTIDKGLTAAGARRIVEMAKADASGTGEMSQDKVILKWIESIWTPLAQELCKEESVDTKRMQVNIIPLLMKLDPDYSPPMDWQTKPSKPICPIPLPMILIPLIGVAIASFVAKMNV